MIHNKYIICYLETAEQIGGGQIGLLDILKNLDYDLFEPWVIVNSDGPFYQQLQQLENVNSCLLRFIYLPKKLSERELLPIYSPLSVNIIRKKIKEIRPHLLHSNHLNAGRYGAKAAFLNKIPNIVTFRCIYQRCRFYYNRFVENRILTYADKVVFNSIRGAELLKERTRKKNIISIVNGIDLDRFNIQSNNIYLEYGIPKNRKVILLPARIYPDKGHLTLIKAAARIFSEYPDLHIVFLGNEDHLFRGAKDYFNSEAVSLGLGNSITWIDYTDNVVPFFKAAYSVVLPSISEGCPRVLLEALAAGTPIIGSRIDGINEIIDEKENGFKFTVKDDLSLSEALKKMFSLSTEQYTIMKNNCIRIAKEKYDIKCMINKYQDLYINLIEQKNRPGVFM